MRARLAVLALAGCGGDDEPEAAAPTPNPTSPSDPGKPERMLVATALGTFSSTDGGRSWRPRDPIPSEQLAWAAPDALYRADPGGAIKVSADGGETWKDRGNVVLPVNEVHCSTERRRGLEAPATAGVARSAPTRGARPPRSPRAGCCRSWR